ncbi:MAG TPA: flagellar basal-body rod protein FlgG [Burkholderiaceae bacterium]
MLDAMNIAATGMRTQQLNVDTIANNLANVNTTGFKKSRVNFVDLVTHGADAAAQSPGAPAMPGLDATQRSGAGVAVTAVDKLFDGGTLQKTGGALDLAITGDGFFEVAQADGSKAYTRGGSFKVDVNGMLASATGQVLQPEIQIPPSTTSVTIAADGKVSVTTATSATPIEVGRLTMARFPDAGALTALGNGLYAVSDTSGEAISGHGGEDGMGTVAQGFLEGSNVKMVDEMVNLMIAQRAYEASVKVVQASDEMMGMVNNLRK